MTHRALGLWEIRAASNPKFSLQKEKANTSGKKRIGNVRERKLEAAILQEANGGPQVALEQPTCCKGQGNVQKSPHANTRPARGLADSPHVVWLYPGKPLGPMQDHREGCSPVAGSSWKHTHVYVSTTWNQSMGLEGLIYIQWLIINGLPRNKGHARAASPLQGGAKPIPPCLLVGNPSAIALGWPLQKQWDPKAKPLKKGKDARLLLGQSSAFWHHLSLLCQDSKPVTRANLNATWSGLSSLPPHRRHWYVP